MGKFGGDAYFAKLPQAFSFSCMPGLDVFSNKPLQVERGLSLSPIPLLASL